MVYDCVCHSGVATEKIWPTKPKILIIWPLMGNVDPRYERASSANIQGRNVLAEKMARAKARTVVGLCPKSHRRGRGGRKKGATRKW